MCDLKKLVPKESFRLGSAFGIFGVGLLVSVILSEIKLVDYFTIVPAIIGGIGGFVWLQYEWHLIKKHKLEYK